RISIARWYSARPKAVRPRSKASRAAGCPATGTVGPTAISAPANAASVATVISVAAAGLELHDVFEALSGADAHALGRERIAVVGRNFDLLARIVVGEERDVDLFARSGRGHGAAAVRIAHQHARGRAGRLGRHDEVRGPPLQPPRDDRIRRQGLL